MNDTKISKRKYTHINQAERQVIERLLENNTPKKQIARMLNRSITTIRNEIKRGSVEQIIPNTKKPTKNEKYYTTAKRYFADVGQREYENNRKNCGRKYKLTQCIEMIKYIEMHIVNKTMSIDAAIGYAKRHQLFNSYCCTQTVYNYIDFGLCNIKNIDLPKKVRFNTHKANVRKHKRAYGRSIDERPACINERLEFGHWEGDGIVGKNHKGHIISLIERKTGYGLLFNVGDKQACRIVDVVDSLQEEYGDLFKLVFKSITFDNGSEFSLSSELERENRTTVYYAHPYSSWERGSNENWNGIVRRYVPKKSSFKNLNDDIVKRIENTINNIPRKRFKYKSPRELYIQELDCLIDGLNQTA